MIGRLLRRAWKIARRSKRRETKLRALRSRLVPPLPGPSLEELELRQIEFALAYREFQRAMER